jgi:hypothetical protein
MQLPVGIWLGKWRERSLVEMHFGLQMRENESATIGLFTIEAIAKHPPFRAGALKTITDVKKIPIDWVNRYSKHRVPSLLGPIPPEEYEQNYYAETIDPSIDEATHKAVA